MDYIWGPTRQSRAKEVSFAVLTKGCRLSPITRVCFLQVCWPLPFIRWAVLRGSFLRVSKGKGNHLSLLQTDPPSADTDPPSLAAQPATMWWVATLQSSS